MAFKAQDPALPGKGAASRIAMVDSARGVALVAMTGFHFCWDLEMFAVLPRGFMQQDGMIWLARAIAGSFLFLAGFSLVLAHGGAIGWKGFAIRLAKVGGAAALISAATFYAIPQAWIFFGILHSIALGSLLALPFLRAPVWLTAAVAVFFLTAREHLRSGAFDHPFWLWSGLTPSVPLSNDYVPLFPFFGAVLLGVAVGRLAIDGGWTARLAGIGDGGWSGRALAFLGRHSLLYYLAHQPVMIALLYGALRLSGNI